jgi:hypothetical protein
MADIEELRRRVEAAQERFGLMDDQQKQYSDRLVGLMDAVDDGIRQQRAFADDLQGEVDKLAHENEELKTMLHALLLAVEHDSHHGLADTMQMLESRAGALVEATESTAALPSPHERDSSSAPDAPMTAEATAAPETEPSAPEGPSAHDVEDVPVTPPKPWDEETVSGAAASESESAQAAEDEEDESGGSTSEFTSPDVEERVKRLIEMTGGSSASG